MITYDNIKTIADLVKAAGEVHGERIFIRYEHDDGQRQRVKSLVIR